MRISPASSVASAVEKAGGKDNWSRVFNAYAAYAHGEQNINRGTIRQDIAYLGGSVFTYKGDFFAGLTGNVAIAHNKTSESLGHDTFNSYLAGFGLKTGVRPATERQRHVPAEPVRLIHPYQVGRLHQQIECECKIRQYERV